MQQNAAENLGKKYVERDCCVVNSCHLYVLICVYLFLGFVSMVELAVFFFFLIEFDSNETTLVVTLIAADFLKLLSKVLGNIGLFLFNQFLDCVGLSVYYTILSRHPGIY